MPPNILFIIADQHNAKVLGCTGYPGVQTPNLDRLATQGVRFENCIAQSPICTPSRMSFFSGQYPHNHGYYGLGGPSLSLPTVLRHFRQRGYRTGAIGKIHCPEYWIEDDCDYFREVYPNLSPTLAREYVAYLDARGLLRDRDDQFYPEQPDRTTQSLDGRPSRLRYEDSPEGWIVRETVGFMQRAAMDGVPFIVQASFPRPHQIYAPSEPFWSMYDEGALWLPPNADYDMTLKAPHLRETAEWYRTGEWTLFAPRTFEAGRLRKLHGYLSCVSQVDYAAGELLSWLSREGLEEDTIVVYSSDHGDYACEHGLMEKAPGICSDAITRVPYLWRWPGHFAAGHVVQHVVESVDLPSTLCSLAGVDPLETGDGKDLSHVLNGDDEPVHELGVSEFAWSKSVRKGRYRYVYYAREMFAKEYPNGFGELYDLENDPWEMHNLYFLPELAARVDELKADLLDWMIETTRPTTVLGLPPLHGRQAIERFNSTTNLDNKVHPGRLRDVKSQNYL